MARLIALDWESDDLGLVEADVSGGSVRIRKCRRYNWPDENGPRASTEVLGSWLRDTLAVDKLTSGDALVVLPREAVVFRRLELPDVPEDELPDLVRFQAATKSSTPLDKLALDFLALPRREGVEGRQVLMVTVDRSRIEALQSILSEANLELKGVGISPIAMAELISRMDGGHSPGPQQATLIIFQDSHRVEITIVRQGQLIFSHETRLQGRQDDRGLRASLTEVNRSTVSLAHSHPDIEISDVCLVHSGDADPAFESALKERFEGQLKVLDINRAQGVRLESSEDAARLPSFAPAVGMLLSQADGRVPRIDFLNPRQAAVVQDRTKLRAGLIAAGVLLAGGVGYGMLKSHISNLNEQAAQYKRQTDEITLKLRAGANEMSLADQIGGWKDQSRHPLLLMDELRELSPVRGRTYLKEFHMSPAIGNVVTHLSGTGNARDARDVEDLYYALDVAGFRVQPAITRPSTNPDFPVQFEMNVDVLPTPKEAVVPGSPRAPAARSAASTSDITSSISLAR